MRRLLSLALALGGLFAFSLPASAELPHTLNFQGRLKDSAGTPYQGSKLVKFTLYDSLGTAIWSSGFNSVSFSGGLFTVRLGAPPHPALPTAAWSGDSSLELGVNIDTDPEIVPRFKMASAGWAFHAESASTAEDATSLGGVDASAFVRAGGDTMSGSLAVLGNLSVGTDTSFTGLSLQSGSNWSWLVNHGWGDFRIGNKNLGFSIGIALDGGGAGTTRMWSRGGGSEDICFGGPTWGDVFCVKSTLPQVVSLADFGIGTSSVVAPLTLASKGRSRWDVGAGLGDMRLVNGAAGLSLGVSSTGWASIWSSGGIAESITLGGPTGGSVLTVTSNPRQIWMEGTTQWFDTAGVQRALVSPSVGSFSVTSPANGSVSLLATEQGAILVRDSGEWAIYMDSRTFGGSINLYRRRPTGAQALGMSLLAGGDSIGSLLQLNDGLGGPKMTFDADTDGDFSVNLPASSINHNEILDEPGIAFNTAASSNFLTLIRSATAQDILTVQLTMPAAGYVRVEGHATFRMSGSTGVNYAWMQIDTGQAGGQLQPVVWTGNAGQTTVNNDYHTGSTSKVYYLPAGPHTFRIEGNGFAANDVAAVTTVYRADITATYYAGSYGAVAGTVAGRAGFDDAEAVTTVDEQSGAAATTYRVDLRELELRAARAQAEAEKARRELLEERTRRAMLKNHYAPEADPTSFAAGDRREPR